MKSLAKQDRIWIRDKTKAEYNILLSYFKDFIKDLYFYPEEYIVHENLMESRASNILNYAFLGYGMSIEEVFYKIKNINLELLDQEEIKERRMLLAVTENLVRFGILSEFQALNDIRNSIQDFDNIEEFEEESEEVFEKYNLRYASVENEDTHYIMGVAASWAALNDNVVLTYTTQGDERVRDNHRALEGISYLKSQFPLELIPPIDWACRCFLLESGDRDLLSGTNPNAEELIKNAVNPIFINSPWNGGMVFGLSHPYFDVPTIYSNVLLNMEDRIMQRLLS